MAELQNNTAQVHVILAESGYDVTDVASNVLSIRQLESGVTIQAVLEGDIVFFSVTCLTVSNEKITPEVMHDMLSSTNGISTSHFQLYEMEEGQTAVALSNFCKLQELGTDDKDDILSCVHFLFADVLAARDLLQDLA